MSLRLISRPRIRRVLVKATTRCSSRLSLSDSDGNGHFGHGKASLPRTRTICARSFSTHCHVPDYPLEWYDVHGYVMDLVHMVHDSVGLSYAVSIAGVTVGFRLFVLIPIGIYEVKRDSAHRAQLNREIDDLNRRVDHCRSVSEKQELQQQVEALKNRIWWHKIQSLGTPILNIAVILTVASGLRYMPVYYPTELAAGGIWWFPDLTQSDIHFILPAVSTVSFSLWCEGGFGINSMGREIKGERGWKFQYFLRGMQLIFFPLFAYAPAATFCYWIPFSTTAILQPLIMSNPTVMRTLGVPPPEKALGGMQRSSTKIQYYDHVVKQEGDPKISPKQKQLSKKRKGRK